MDIPQGPSKPSNRKYVNKQNPKRRTRGAEAGGKGKAKSVPVYLSSRAAKNSWNYFGQGMPWLVSAGFLWEDGCEFWLSKKEQFMICPDGERVELIREGRSTYVGGFFAKRGVFQVQCASLNPSSRLLLDSGAEMNVAGEMWKDRLNVGDGKPEKASGIGGVCNSGGHGTMIMDYSKTGGRRVRSPWEAVSWEAVHHEFTPEDDEHEGHVFMGQRTARFPIISDEKDFSARTGIVNLDVINNAHENYLGVGKMDLPKGTKVMSEDYLMAHQSRRAVNKTRTADSLGRDVKMGSRWSFDLTPYMYLGFDEWTYGIMFMEHRTGYMKVYPMKNKSAESVIGAVEKLRVWVAALGDGCKLEELRGGLRFVPVGEQSGGELGEREIHGIPGGTFHAAAEVFGVYSGAQRSGNWDETDLWADGVEHGAVGVVDVLLVGHVRCGGGASEFKTGA